MTLKILIFFKKNKSRLIAGGFLLILFSGITLIQAFFPRYPQRINYVIGELYQTNKQLVYLNQELKGLTEECNCANAVSQCGRKTGLTPPSQKDIEINSTFINTALTDPAGSLEEFENELNRAKSQLTNSLNNLNIYLVIGKEKKISGIEGKILTKITLASQISPMQPVESIATEEKEKLKKIEQSIKNTNIKSDVSFNASDVANIEERIKGLEGLKNALTEEQSKLENLKKETTKNLNFPDKEIENKLGQAQNRLQEKINQVPKIPIQLIAKLTQITEDLKQQITSLPQSIKSLLIPFGCDPVSPEAFGETCPQRKEIEKIQVDIRNKTDQIYFLTKLLKKEMETGLEAELETLRPEEAEQLKTNLNQILNSTEEIITPSLNNVSILNDPQYLAEEKCRANCEEGVPLGFSACILDNLGEQSPIKLEFEVSVSLDKIELGEVGIKGLRLNLPEKIDLSSFEKFNDYKINLSDLGINFPPISLDEELNNLSMPPIVIHPPSLDLPNLPSGEFSCPVIASGTNSSASYQCSPSEEKTTRHYTDLEWYLQTFSWLSEKCQELPGMKDQYGAPKEECWDKNNVHLAVIKQCDVLWQQYFACKKDHDDCATPPAICQRYKNVQQECRNLFQQQGESTPSDCTLKTLQNKCSQLKEQGTKEAPESCKTIPLFSQEMGKPNAKIFEGEQTTCPSQTIFDNAGSGLRVDCPLNFPSIPNIQLPDIIIPDINLPSFSFMPFLKVNLPSFIFEDLLFSQLNLCNLDDCQDIIPPISLNISYPVLNISSINIPTIEAVLPGLPDMPALQGTTLPIEFGQIEFPPIPIPLPEIDLTNLISLETQMPEIPIPAPDIAVDFKGIDIKVLNMLLGLVSKIIDIPNGCIATGIGGLPLVIGLDDYYFSWPKFPMPEIPDLCNNERIQINDFCQSVKGVLDEKVASKVTELQKAINKAIQQDIQPRLDEISLDIRGTIEKHISSHLDKIKTKVEQGIEKHLTEYINDLKLKAERGIEGKTKRDIIKEGMLHIPSARIPLEELGEIEIPMEKINKKLSKIPKEIEIPWPEKLKDIKIDKPITYQLPDIPLDGISYTKWVEIDIPGFQYKSLQFGIDFMGNYGSCKAQSPSGGNPYPISEISVNLEKIIGANKKMADFSEKINQILE